MFNDQFSRTSSALSRANRLLNTYYRPVGAYDEKSPPKLDAKALRAALRDALDALGDEDGAADREPDSDFTREDLFQRARDAEASFTSVENRPSNHVTGRRKDGDFTRQTADSALALDAAARQQQTLRRSMREGSLNAEFRSMLGSAAAHRRDWQ
jgi:hypothetical protein